ncbi:MAG: porin, partial [Ectothiorhodospiraceae bacterium]
VMNLIAVDIHLGTAVDVNGDEVHDPSYGVGGTLDVTERLGLSARYAVDGSDETDTDYYGASVAFDYGAGDLYGAVQEVDPDEGDAQTQFAAGANYFIADNLYVYGEYGAFDAPSSADADTTDSLYELGAIYEF